MPEEDERIFGEIWNIYNKYRWKIMTSDDFILLTQEIAAFAELHKWKENPLACRMAEAMIDTFNDMYRVGKVPKIPDYFGRSDL